VTAAAAFDRVLGQEHAKALLAAALSRDRVAHTWLFSGPDGAGKTLLAAEFAKALLCRATGAPHEDDDCAECRMITADNHPDFMLVQAAEGKRVITIDQARAMSQALNLRPVQSQRRVAVIREADRMLHEAANALLKTLEEPPSYVTLILTTHRPRNLLDTIRSRSRQVRFAPLAPEHIRRILSEQTEFPPGQVAVAARLSEGSAGKAFRALESGCIEFHLALLQRVLALPDEAPFHLADDLLIWLKSAAGNLETQRVRLRELLRLLTCAYRDALLLRKEQPSERLFHQEQADLLRAAAQRLTPPQISRIIEALWNARRQTDQNAALNLILESLFTRIAALQRPVAAARCNPLAH